MAGVFVQSVYFELYGAPLDSMLASPDGPVGRDLTVLAERALEYAKTHCPVETEESAAHHPGDPKRQPGRLRESLHIQRLGVAGRDRAAFGGGGLYLLVGSDLDYARKIEYNPRVGGFLRGALAQFGAHHIVSGRPSSLASSVRF